MTTDPRLTPVHEHMSRALEAPDDARVGLYHWLRYQLGWSEPDGRPADQRTGKGVRPLLCLIACQAVGGEAASAVPAAAAVELTHEFSLIHDDIEDGDRTRRGRAALWTVCGTAQGINAGDALFGIARQQVGLSPVSDGVMVDLYRRYDLACVRLAEGQYLDLLFETQQQPTVPDYLDMVARKTGALIAAAASLGARAGGADARAADAISAFGVALGVAFQIQDDVLGMWGDPATTGKPVGSDLQRRKKSLPLLLALDEPSLAPDLEPLLEGDPPSSRDAAAAAARIEAAGIREHVTSMAQARANEAIDQLDGLQLAGTARDELVALAFRVVHRDR